ncbi:flagellar basal body-associated FliL family protein [Paracoccus ravus]|uniref:flagellar basal body-associated FliL family protein n=1 Tax=Paracoccus ravus TaxID=2447760 RepID=UPI001FD65431|nr:flagellar basal body-associated FliL family protein [Paracoccus ravus]
MLHKIIVAVLAIAAFVGGALGGEMLRARLVGPGETASAAIGGDPHAGTDGAANSDAALLDGEREGDDWFRFPKQFFVPILRNGSTDSVMVLTLTLEISADARPEIEAREFRLRDAMLNALMIESNTGAFDGNFTSQPSLDRLRSALLKAARQAGGPKVARVLIEDIARQQQ